MAANSTGPAPGPSSEGYSIQWAAKLTGISADTLRVWERRYGFPSPQRNARGVRRYSMQDIARLQLIGRALVSGFRAHEVVGLPLSQLQLMLQQAQSVAHQPPAAPARIAPLLDMLRQEQVDELFEALQQGALELGPQAFVTDLAAPLLEHTGFAWQFGRIEVRHEHLISAQLSALLSQLRMSQPPALANQAPAVLLTTLPGELHTLGIEMVALYLAVAKVPVRILGASTPIEQILGAAQAHKVRAVGLSISLASSPITTRPDVIALDKALDPLVELWLGGKGAQELSVPSDRIQHLPTFETLDQHLQGLLS